VSSCLCQLFALFCFIQGSGTFAAAQVTFNKPDFHTGKAPLSIDRADFNRDGLLDVVTANSQDNSITILLNNGNSTLGRRTDYPVGANPSAVVAGDFDHDGVPDVAVANRDDNTVSIFLGNGDGTLRLLSTFAVGSSPDALVVADFNRDGNLDLAVANSGDNTFSVFLGNRKGAFTHSADYTSGTGPAGFFAVPAWIVTADFNGDGIPDLATTNGNADDVSIFLGKGNGTFRAGASFTVVGADSGTSDGRMIAADFNHDGKTDLLVEHLDCPGRECFDGFTVFAGHGDGTFDNGHPFPLNTFNLDMPMIAADLNGDRVPDVIAPDQVVLVDPATVFTDQGTGGSINLLTAGQAPVAFAAGDFNGDGKTDIVTANNGDNTVSLLQGNGDGTFHQLLRYAYPGGVPGGITGADFNKDGVPDLVLDDAPGSVWLYMSNRDGSFRTPVQMAPDLESFQVAAVDANNDGIPDLLIDALTISSNTTRAIVRTLLGNGDGTFRAPVDSDCVVTEGGFRVADVNGDGIPDVIVLTGAAGLNDAIYVCMGNGDGSFRPPITTTIPFASSSLAVGDFNHDGKLDAAVGFTRFSGNAAGSVIVYLGNGDGTFTAGQQYEAQLDVGWITAADINGDGVLDLLVLHGPLTVFLGKGDGTFTQLPDTTVSGGSQVLVADLNGDGKPDLVLPGGQVSVLLGNGDGTLQPEQLFPIGGGLSGLIGDFNRDGHPDIAVTTGDLVHGSLSLLLSGNGPPPAHDFHLVLGSASATVKAGQAAATKVIMTAIGSFSGVVKFSCAGPPEGVACNFNPPNLAPGASGQATSALTITTQAPGGARGNSGNDGGSGSEKGRGDNDENGGGKKDGNGDGHGRSGTPKGTHVITVIGTSNGSPTITHVETFTLVVK
jgi:hypothetical protein